MTVSNNSNSLRLCTYNCRSLKNSLHDICTLCTTHDIVLLQEHWLLPGDLSMLNNVDNNFIGIGVSAVDTGTDILKGRPYGGTAILYRKSFASSFTVVDCCDEPRMCAVCIATNSGPILLINVYMPTDLSDDASYDEYVDICTKIMSVFTDCDASCLVLAGDFNCRADTRFHRIFSQFLTENKLNCIDVLQLSDVVTFVSDDGLRTSWIDHIVCSQSLTSVFTDVKVMSDLICSDHRPLSALLKCSVSHTPWSPDMLIRPNKSMFNWSNLAYDTVDKYKFTLDSCLSNVDIPSDVLCNGYCNVPEHKDRICDYYDCIIRCIQNATAAVIPQCTVTNNKHNVPGWSDLVADKHDVAREAYKKWLYDGKPRCGLAYEQMYKSRTAFKQALKFCQRHKEQMQADALAHSYKNMDSKQFWRTVSSATNQRATARVNKIGNAVGEENICAMWFDYFKNLYNSVPSTIDSGVVNDACAELDFCNGVCISVDEVKHAIHTLKKAKSAGPNGLMSESFIHSGVRLWVHLSIFFTLCIHHGYLPANFMDINITPLVKNKCGDLTDMNNYRAIALCNIESKILEKTILTKVMSYIDCDQYQFGFKKGHSTTLCAGIVKQSIDYYISRGSHVFVCFIDYCKAFDKVNYWKLFKQLIDDGVNGCIVNLLVYWYSHQQATVLWLNTQSNSFYIGNGTKQGGILSPYLFTRYIRQLLLMISTSKIGCHVGGIAANIFAYADDVVLLAPSWHAMQELIALVAECCKVLDLECNVRKTKCMVINPTDSTKSKIVSKVFPHFMINGQSAEFVQ